MPSTAIVWFRNDLRIADHEPLLHAAQDHDLVIPVYCFDPRLLGSSRVGQMPRMTGVRYQFLMKCLEDLRESLKKIGGDLVCRIGKPEEVLSELAKLFQVDALYFHQEVASEETFVENAVEKSLSKECKIHCYWNSTLCHRDDLPFADIDELPNVFTEFRKCVEKEVSWREPLPAPSQITLPEQVQVGSIPTYLELQLNEPTIDSRSAVSELQAGETGAWQRLDHYLWEAECITTYKETRNGLLGLDYSTKFSPYLASGCISARSIAAEVMRFEAERVRNRSTYWVIFELLWRDYFRFVALKFGDQLFKRGGLQGKDLKCKFDQRKWEAWTSGNTGYPFIDANMRELNQTGFMSNRGRQNVASFLVRDLKLDWRLGAEYFESLLIDYDVCSNWGNWAYGAGVGNDPREDRYFNVVGQGKRYDEKGAFVRHWLPELKKLSNEKIHTPWELRVDEQNRDGIRLGIDYPNKIVELRKR